MIIGIDGNEANMANRVGVNKYAFEIIKAIYNLLPQNADLIVYVYLRSDPLSDMPPTTKNFRYKILKGNKVWIVSKLTPYLLSNPEKLDIFFSPNHYLPPFSSIPMICAIMDLGFLKSSEQFKKYDFWQLKYWTAWSVMRSKYILTISNATQNDIVRQYPNSRNKIVVTYPGYDKYLTTKEISATSIINVKKKYTIVGDYILYLGTLKPSKNIEGLIRALSILAPQHPETSLVIAGKKGWLYKPIFELIKELKLERNVIFTDFIAEKEKPPLIKGAKLFVLPSFWEGFGLDILTAFALKVPVVASNVGSIPEVLGNAGFLVDPSDINSIKDGIKKALNMSKVEYAKLVAKEKAQLMKFSWEKASQITLETFRKAVSKQYVQR